MSAPGHRAHYWFTLLGSVQAWRDDVELALGPPQQRTVLALLVLHRGQALSVHDLVDGVWPTDPPRTAPEVIRSYVHRLRKVLSSDSVAVNSSLITTVGNRYLIRLDPDQYDLGVFRAELAAAETSRRDGDGARADGHFRAALELWRGRPLGSLPDAAVEPFRIGLLAAHRAAVEARFAHDLRHGRFASAAVELMALVADDPLDERFRELLMIALCRGGRPAEALTVYHAGARVLASELGVDPGPALRVTHQRILTADPTLLTDTPGDVPAVPADTTPTERPVPRQLPAELATFAGRSADLHRLDELSGMAGASDAPVFAPVIVSGIAGVGKSTLVLRWAHRHLDRFPDGQIHLDLRGFGPAGEHTEAVGPSEALLAVLTALGVPVHSLPADSEGRAAAYRSALAGRRVLVVADNAADEAQVRPLVSGSPGSALVITSRLPLLGLVAADNARALAIEVVAEQDAREILTARLGSRIGTERPAVSAIVARCAGLPLALAVVAARAASRPAAALADIAAELDEHPRRLDAFGLGDHRTDVREVFSWSYRALSPQTARAFRLLALSPAPEATVDTAAALLDRPEPLSRRCLQELRRSNLLGEPTAGRYAYHDLLRDYALELCRTADTDTERNSAVDRLQDHVLDIACAAAFALTPYEIPGAFRARLAAPAGGSSRFDRDSAMAWFARERVGLVALVRDAARRGEAHAWHLAWAISGYLDRSGHWHEQRDVHEVSLAAARAGDDLLGQAYAHRGLARVHANFADLTTAREHIDHATTLFDRAEQVDALADTYRQSSWIAEQTGDLATALTHARRGLAIHRTTTNRLGRATALNAVGWYHALRGEFADALAHCADALALLTELGHHYGQADTLDSIGYAQHRLGRHDHAVRDYIRAIELYQQVGVVFAEADTTDRLGDALHAVGDRTGAHHAWERSAALFGGLCHANETAIRAKLDDLATATSP